MKLYIPEIGDTITLTKDWNFDLFHEYRNAALIKAMLDMEFKRSTPMISTGVSLAGGTELKIDRIYIRKGKSGYSSLTFYIKSGTFNGKRFWAKLTDVNKIEFEVEKVVEVPKKLIKPYIAFDNRIYTTPFKQLKEGDNIGSVFVNHEKIAEVLAGDFYQSVISPKTLLGFKLTEESYGMPSIRTYSLFDLKTGKMVSKNITKASLDKRVNKLYSI